jgi:Na+-translocating ferredoxin:NAD+ oxidoreductase RnfC subunit
MLLKMATILGKKRQKRVSVKIGFSIKNMQSLSSGKNQVIFSRKKRIFVGGPLTCCFCEHYYNAGLIFGHL